MAIRIEVPEDNASLTEFVQFHDRVFASERLTGALLDRLTHHVHILELNGDSFRLKHSKRRISDDQPPSEPG